MSSAATMSAPIALIDTLNALLEAELTSIFRFMGEGSPHLGRANADVKRPLAEMVETIKGRARRLINAVEHLGGTPALAPSTIDPEEQYLAYLSLKFLLPKLLEAKAEMIERYQNALKTIKGTGDMLDEIRQLLTTLMNEHRDQLKLLEEASHTIMVHKG